MGFEKLKNTSYMYNLMLIMYENAPKSGHHPQMLCICSYLCVRFDFVP